MSKRAFFPLLLGLLILTFTGCLFGGEGSEEALEQTEAASTAVPVPTATSAPASEDSSAANLTPTQVATAGELFLQLVEPTETEVFTDVGSMTVAGRTRVDAMVTINDTIVEPNIDGEFSLNLVLEEGPNIIELVSSVASGEQMDLVLVAVYVP